MGKKSKIRTTIIKEPIEDTEDEVVKIQPSTEAEYETVDDVDEALSDLEEDTKGIYFYRMYERGRPKFLEMMVPGQFGLQSFRDAYGGGRYRYRAKKKDGKVKLGEFEIDGEPMLQPPQRTFTPTTGLSHGEAFAQIMARLDKLETQRSQHSMTEGLTEKLLLGFLAQKEDTDERIINKLSAYKTLFSGGGSEGIGRSLVDTIKELAPILAGGEISPWMMMIDKLGPILEKVAGNLTTTTVRPGAAVSRPPSPELAPLPGPVPNQGPEKFPVETIVRPYIPMFLTAASRDADPSPYVEIVMDQTPEDQKAALLAWLQTNDWWPDLVKLDNRIGLQGGWWDELHGLLLERFQPDATPDVDESEPSDAV